MLFPGTLKAVGLSERAFEGKLRVIDGTIYTELGLGFEFSMYQHRCLDRVYCYYD